MSHKIAYGAIGLWAIVVAVLWAVAVPSVLSLSTLGWASALFIGAVVAISAAQRSGEQTRSLAGILYDTDHPTDGKP